ncbi:hypothetical protein PTTG_04324 [Puccinia triticina 1-1 BBBD Race 1]|uniref:Uncharacterized protein n=2 Tax=Puccinia triticina TaxID=208348 RepID=A0A180GMX1_PUCT1|nr:uncharacterized protein PtA15_1A1007 [Puccinia triticina]OAV94157.1 hypothetical protein PTTG_04324 [Puccinia triticina 1-1 BBBD Race 1]WAQ81665.1 hypothetical protein PtA15_1A1007 [Puccinia triticina]WAR52552.1 hypothetical protein PtB15_1B994 [Puccinia triticina]
MCSQTRSQFPLSTLNPTSSISGPSRRATRKAVFRIFCDDDIEEAAPSVDPSNLRAHKSGTVSHPVVNNKENQVPELDNRTIAAPRQTNRSYTRSRVLGDKTASASARVNCVEKWDSKIPFAPCGSSLGKSTLLHPIKTELSKPRTTPHSRSVKGTKNQSKTAASHTQPTKRLSSHIYCPESENASQPTTLPQAIDDGLDELVSKLEALQANDENSALEILDPLPPNAACPGAPKMPSAFTMPVFVADEGHCDDEQTAEFKLTNSLQMSPLAEVTEAFTGLQGGWSPPLETSSPVFNSHFFENISIRPDQA